MRKESGYNRLYGALKYKCKERNLFLDLPYEVFKELIVRPCQYCGAEPTATNKNPTLKDFKFNGLDRVDNKQGYYEKNVVPCCAICNSMKSTMSPEDFMNHVRNIASNSNF